MPLSRSALGALVLASACQAPAPPAAPPPGAVVARVNGAVLTEDDLALQPAARGHQPARQETRAAILDALVTEELAAQKAVELGLEPDPKARRELARLQAELVSVRRRALANAWYAQVARQALQPTDEEVAAYVAAHGPELRRQVHVLMALRRTEREIRQVQEVLDAGASLESVQRAALAGAAGTPWDLGWLGHGQLAPAWRPALAALKPGEVSGVLEGDHERYWILQLLEVREAPVQSPEALRALVQQVLGAERALPAREAAEAALRAKAQVVIDKKE